jgi:hypothetical protein
MAAGAPQHEKPAEKIVLGCNRRETRPSGAWKWLRRAEGQRRSAPSLLFETEIDVFIQRAAVPEEKRKPPTAS